MKIIDSLSSRAKAAFKTIVLPEGQDARVVAAAVAAAKGGICQPIVLGTPEEIAAAEATAGVSLAEAGIKVIDYTTSDLLPQLAELLYERRKAKGMTAEEALEVVKSKRLYFGNLMVAKDLAQGLVAGAVASTGEMLVSSFHCIGTAKGIKKASSNFVMDLQGPTVSGDTTLLFADCAVNPFPTVEELVDIAQATAMSFKQLVGKQPRLAFLSYSSKGSAKHELVDKLQQAVTMTRERFAEIGLDAVVDGELQGDAALVPSVAASKNRGGVVQGDANVLIFPDIQSGNIAYKLVERLAGAIAYGPILQGLAKPVNDLSRGCTADDIVGVICITICQGL
ncbi:MAG: phosphate acetyltransferase [Lentisphaerae bacterium]|nr:phosphate acetyltransferase [Lentisphaerota bacterium]